MVQTGIFWIYWKIWSLVFSQFGLWWTLMFLPYSCTDSIIRFLIYVPKCSWTIRLHVFNFNYASRKKWWNEFYYVDTNSRKVKIGYNFFFFLAGHDQKRVTQKLAISQEVIGRINHLSVWWCKFREAKFLRGMFENRCGLFGCGTRKSAVSQEWID